MSGHFWHYNRKYDFICKVDGCNNKHHSNGYCSKHYTRFTKYGDITVNKKWGKATHPLYKIWDGIKQRCYNPNHFQFKNYGGRGIKMCERWLLSFDNFIEDMGSRPSFKHQIDRENNNGDYDPSNCRWVLPIINARNRRTTKLNEWKVRVIKRLIESQELKQQEIADIFKVSRRNIGFIKNGERWRDI